MYLLYFIFISIIPEILGKSCITVKDSGTYLMTPGDVGMVFWVSIENTCKHKFHVKVKMIQCTEFITESEEETAGMYLIGGYMGILQSKSTIKTTLIYPNMYLYNRQGSCIINILYTDENHDTNSARANILFSTVPHAGEAPKEVRSFYQTSKSLKPCETPDLDQLDNCHPVDCMMKYLGVRSYYNARFKRCQKVPVCVSDSMKDEPDVSYVPTSNRCRNLDNLISENDIALLEDGIVSNSSFSSLGLFLRCHNGRLDNSTGTCKCRKGYTSVEPDIENYIPGLSVYHMCTIKVRSWNQANLPKLENTILAFSTLAVVITMVIILLTICCYGVYLYVKRYEEISPFEQSDNSDDLDCDKDCCGDSYNAALRARSRSRNFDHKNPFQ